MLTCSTFKFTSSETRNPLAYKTSNMARSRSPKGTPQSGSASKASTSCSVKPLGNALPIRGDSILAVGSDSRISSRHK